MFVWQAVSLGVSGRDALRYLLAPCPWGAAGGTPETFFSMGLAGAEKLGGVTGCPPWGQQWEQGRSHQALPLHLQEKRPAGVNPAPLWPKQFISQNLGTA